MELEGWQHTLLSSQSHCNPMTHDAAHVDTYPPLCKNNNQTTTVTQRSNKPMPRWVLILAYRAVPVKFLFSRYGICWWVFESRYFFARPKSITYTRLPFLPRPMRKLSGLISRWMKFFEWMYSIRLICNQNGTTNETCKLQQVSLEQNASHQLLLIC